MVRHPALLSFEESCKLELKLVEQEATIKALRDQVMYWRLLMKEFCDSMDEAIISEYKKTCSSCNKDVTDGELHDKKCEDCYDNEYCGCYGGGCVKG